MRRDGGPLEFHTFGPLRWWSFTYQHSPHLNVALRFWRVQVHVEAWANRYPASPSRCAFRVGFFYDRKRGRGYAESEQP